MLNVANPWTRSVQSGHFYCVNMKVNSIWILNSYSTFEGFLGAPHTSSGCSWLCRQKAPAFHKGSDNTRGAAFVHCPKRGLLIQRKYCHLFHLHANTTGDLIYHELYSNGPHFSSPESYHSHLTVPTELYSNVVSSFSIPWNIYFISNTEQNLYNKL